MRLPPGSIPTDYRERKRKKERIRREAERRRDQVPRLPSGPILGSRSSLLMPVLAVLLLMGVMLTSRSRQAAKLREARRPPSVVATEELEALAAAIGRFRLHMGRWPTSEEGLKALVVNPGHPHWNGAYINILHPDPWGAGYVYRELSNGVTLASCGPDLRFGTPDDLHADPLDFDVGSAWTNSWKRAGLEAGEVRILKAPPR